MTKKEYQYVFHLFGLDVSYVISRKRYYCLNKTFKSLIELQNYIELNRDNDELKYMFEFKVNNFVNARLSTLTEKERLEYIKQTIPLKQRIEAAKITFTAEEIARCNIARP